MAKTPDGTYIAVDFGIMGTLNPSDQHYLAENFLAFFNRDYRRVAELHVESGWVPKRTRVDEFEAAIRTVSEPIFQRPLREISFGHFLLRLFQTARRFDMEVQPQLVLLQKTLLNIEGLGRQLYPDLDLWKTAKPFLERWTRDQVGPKAFVSKLGKNLPQWLDQVPDMPLLAHKLLRDASDGRLTVQWQSRELERLRQDLRSANERTVAAVSGAALLVSGALTLTSGWGAALFPGLGGTVLGSALGGLGGLVLITLWLRPGR